MKRVSQLRKLAGMPQSQVEEPDRIAMQFKTTKAVAELCAKAAVLEGHTNLASWIRSVCIKAAQNAVARSERRESENSENSV